jgi:hypothetical protein
MTTQQRTTSWTGTDSNTYPVDNPTYNLLQAATSACEAVEAYRKYAKDGDQQLFESLAQDQWRHAEQLIDALHQRLMSSPSGGTMGKSGAAGSPMGSGSPSSMGSSSSQR